MNNCMEFPDSVDEFMEEYKMVDTEYIYSNGTEYVPIFRMKQWFEHLPPAEKTGKWIKEIKHHKDQFQEFNYYTIKCSVCGSAPEKNWHLTPFCPNCGSRMLEEDEQEDEDGLD